MYSLPTACPVKWTATQERSILKGYSNVAGPSTADPQPGAVKILYLQFLWLPESLMSLQRLRLSLERLIPRSADPIRLADLESLFLTSRECSEKYQRSIPEILNAGNPDEPADFEQTMMWFAFKNDKPSEESVFGDLEDEKEEKWKKDWLDRMERREVQIQIILHMFRLCHPINRSAEDVSTSPKKRKQRNQPQTLSLEEKLESLMDKLAMWQLLRSIGDHGINVSSNDKPKEDRDWMQVFCEDVVQEMFCKLQPDICKLLHSKVFRQSLFSDDTDVESPPPDNQKRKTKRQKTLPATLSHSRGPSLPRSTSFSTSVSRSRSAHSQHDPNSTSTLARSRSLSISLEAEAKAVTNGKKRMLTREISMSKGFKRSKSSALPDLPPEPPVPAVREKPKPTVKDWGLERAQSQVLVEDTPVKPIKQFDGARPFALTNTAVTRVNGAGSRASSKKSSSPLEAGEEQSFITDTPVKSGRAQKTGLQLRIDLEGCEDEDDEEWMIGSPSVRRSLVSALTDEDATEGALLDQRTYY